jgi:predicted HicB family RNase H-like nuclease
MKGVLDFAKGQEGTKHYSARMSTALWERARLYSFNHRVSFNELLKNALEEYLDKEIPAQTDGRIV